MADKVRITQATVDSQPRLLASLADAFEQRYPAAYAIAAAQTGAPKDRDALRQALGAMDELLADHCQWDEDRTRIRLEGEFLYAVHLREWRKRAGEILGRAG